MRSLPFAMLVVSTLATRAAADTPPAEQLFREGRDLMAAGKLDEACQRFEQSLAIADEVGPRMNLALCEEKRGRVLAALAGFAVVQERARTLGDSQILDVAGKHIAALRAQTAHVVIRGKLPASARVVVKRPQYTDTEARGDAPIPQDPSHGETDRARLVITACGYRDFESQPIALVEGKPSEVAVQLTPLTDGPVVVAQRPHKTLGYVLLVTGAQAVGGSIGYGLWQRDRAQATDCVSSAACVDDHNRNMRIWGTTLFGAGLSMIAAGAYFAFIQSPRAAERALAVQPVIGPQSFGLAWSGSL